MSRSSDRGQTEPLAALVAVAVVSLALGWYAGVLDASLPGQRDRVLAETTLSAVEDEVAPAGVVRTDRIGTSPSAGPSGYRTRVVLATESGQWTAGPTPPGNAQRASERVAVRVAPGRIVPGRLRVVVWK